MMFSPPFLSCTQSVETSLVCRTCQYLKLNFQRTVLAKCLFTCTCDLCYIIQGSDDFVKFRQDDHLICISASYYCISSRIGVSQRLRFSVTSSILVCNDDCLNTFCLDLLAVHDQVSIRVTKSFLRYDNTVQV